MSAQADGSDRVLTEPAEHHGVDHAAGGREQVLERYRHGDPRDVPEKFGVIEWGAFCHEYLVLR